MDTKIQTIIENNSIIQEKTSKVYEAGKKSEYDTFWDAYQSNGQPRNYSNRFFSWDKSIYRPKYPIIAYKNGSCQNCFAYSNITDTLVDITFEENCDVQYFFQQCKSLVTVRKITCAKTSKLTNLFYQCIALRDITFEGEIGYGFNISYSSAVTHDSLMNIINHLYDYKAAGSTSTYTMTFGATNLAKLTDAEKAIATQKGWTLA